MEKFDSYKFLSLPILRWRYLCVFMFCCVFGQAQNNGLLLTWDSMVGCYVYGQDFDVREKFLEEIDETTPCIRTCEYNTVTFTLQGNDIAQIDWFVNGAISSTSTSINSFSVTWGDHGAGSLGVTVTLTNGSQITKTLCIEKIISPRAHFTVTSPNSNLTFCEGVPVNFENLSTTNGGSALISYLWDFGDGTFSSDFEPTHTFTAPGHYEVFLEVRNACNCVDKYRYKVQIIEPALPISCPSVACENSSQTYTVEGSDCDIEWQIEGGTIVNILSNNSVQVVWDQVDDDGFGYVSALNPCLCHAWTTVKIPVIKNSGVIQGPTDLCLPVQERFTLPRWPGTSFEWSLIDVSTGQPADDLIQTDQLNEVIVSPLSSGTYLLKCIYNNELIQCGGLAELLIEANKGPSLLGEFRLCENTLGAYESNFTDTTWALSFQNTIISSGFGATFQHQFTQAGVYNLSASSPQSCEAAITSINVLSTPVLNGAVTGDTQICAGQPYTYSIPSVSSDFVLHWEVEGGVIQGPSQGNQIEIIFNQNVPAIGHYTVNVFKQRINSPFCSSTPVSLQVFPKDIHLVLSNADQTNEFCPSSFTSFSFSSVLMSEIEDIHWRIESAFGNTNFGNIISGQGTPNIQVSWNEITDTPEGFVYVDIRFCGNIATFSYPVTLLDIPTLQWTDGIIEVCAGPNNTFQLSIGSSIPIQSGTIIWNLGNGNTTTQMITAAASTFTSPTLSYENTTDVDVNQVVTATLIGANGCNNSISISKNILVKPSPRITITPGYNYGVCPDSSGMFSVNLTANLQGGLTIVGAIEWYKLVNGIPQLVTTGVTNNGIQLNVTQQQGFGNYFAQATAANGCTERSRIIRITEFCGSPATCTLPFTPTVTAALTTPINCSTFEIIGQFTHTPAYIQWFLPPPVVGLTLASSVDTANQTLAQFDVTAPGNYLIFYEVFYSDGNGSLCKYSYPVEVNIPFITDLRYELTCLGNGTYDLSIFDNSTHILPPAAFQQQQYTFSVNQVVQANPNNNNFIQLSALAAGTYTLGLQLSNPLYPDITTCYAEVQVELFAAPDTQFTISHDPNCVEQAVFLTLNTPVQAGFQYRWSFDNTSFIVPPTEVGQSTTVINLGINTPQNETTPITLTITDPNGCVHTQQISTDEVVSKAEYFMSIQGGGPYCEGEQVVLNLNNIGGTTPVGFQWMRGNQAIAGATGATYAPTQSGNYWVLLYNDQGCLFRGIGSTNVSFYAPPHIQIHGDSVVCSGTSFALEAQVSGHQTLEKRWLRDGVPLHPWSTTQSLTLEYTENTPGTYVFTLEVRQSPGGQCGHAEEFTVTVLETPEVQLSYAVLSCNPYTVKLMANATGSGGHFLWSNADNGETITVTEGGAFMVTYFANNGCTATAQLFVPKNPEIYLWLFPTGCYTYCKEWIESGMLLPAPNASFDTYQWSQNQAPVLSGSGFSEDYTLNQPGTYTQILRNEDCQVESGTLAFTEVNCEECDIDFRVSRIQKLETPFLMFHIYGVFNNVYNTDITLELSSQSADGVYQPSTVFIPMFGNFVFNPLVFIPNALYAGGTTTLRFTVKDKFGRVICTRSFILDIPQLASAKLAQTEASFDFYPNPTKEFIHLSYALTEGQQGSIEIYDLTGKFQQRATLFTHEGLYTHNVSTLPTGQYVIVLYADGKAVKQHLFIKH